MQQTSNYFNYPGALLFAEHKLQRNVFPLSGTTGVRLACDIPRTSCMTDIYDVSDDQARKTTGRMV